MTQIQEIENLSQPDLVKLIKFERQQHADDMDMLAKELAGKGMRPYSLNLDPLGIRALTSDGITGAFEFGRLNTYRPPEGHWLESFWKMGNAASPAAQAQWIEHCSITDIPDAVLTPSGLAIKSEQVQPGLIRFDFINADGQPDSKMLTHDQMRSRYADLFASAAAVPTDIVAAQEPLPPLNDDLIAILGRPNFMCAGIAQLLRDSGHEIKKRAENEQAAALHFLLGHYLSDPQNWNWKVAIALNPDKTTCTCPSVDGTQKWPCPVHPPEV
ncbi:hypothetical protein [Paenalcaligenes suwonensis]|uniref:hypothetical protein n=1 Tax=Paenalcaligenes suwonensis TaxID=1202713 RepID=UPI001409E1D0|nr:hypothetical protein [Paenalcaligenes suwonensis]NHC63056.1 hypothetical protein [Paenalcaligenes suwonensis]